MHQLPTECRAPHDAVVEERMGTKQLVSCLPGARPGPEVEWRSPRDVRRASCYHHSVAAGESYRDPRPAGIHRTRRSPASYRPQSSGRRGFRRLDARSTRRPAENPRPFQRSTPPPTDHRSLRVVRRSASPRPSVESRTASCPKMSSTRRMAARQSCRQYEECP